MYDLNLLTNLPDNFAICKYSKYEIAFFYGMEFQTLLKIIKKIQPKIEAEKTVRTRIWTNNIAKNVVATLGIPSKNKPTGLLKSDVAKAYGYQLRTFNKYMAIDDNQKMTNDIKKIWEISNYVPPVLIEYIIGVFGEPIMPFEKRKMVIKK